LQAIIKECFCAFAWYESRIKPFEKILNMNIREWRLNMSLLGKTIFFVAWFNAICFVLLTADPVIVQDSWYYLGAFLRHAIDGTLSYSDFFVRRAGIDHSQPLYKLIYLAELRWFQLDFMPQAILGIFSAVAIAYILSTFLPNDGQDSHDNCRYWMAIAIFGVMLFSLNSTEIWTWPDVALQYVGFLFAFLFFSAGWKAISSGVFFPLVAMSVALTTIAADVSLLAMASLLAVTIAFWLRQFNRRNIIRCICAVIISAIMIQTLLHWITPIVGVSVRHSSTIEIMIALSKENWLKMIVLPLANSVVVTESLKRWVPDNVWMIQVIVAVFLLIMHGWFWKQFLYTKISKSTYFSTCLMLFFYALVAGIIYGRVTTKGSDYLNSPRYVMYYQFNIIALTLMFVGTYVKPLGAPGKIFSSMITAAAVTLIALQIPASSDAWSSAPYHRAAYESIAKQIIAIGEQPNLTPPNCAPELPLCKYSPEKRQNLIQLLQKDNLNIYSNGFRQMHGLNHIDSKWEGTPSGNSPQG
jgi:hypothetical protein